MIDAARLAYLSTFTLGAGSHPQPRGDTIVDGQASLMEAVSWLANEPWGEAPTCTCPVLATFLRSWNNALAGEDRTRLLRPLVARVARSRATLDGERTRSFLAMDWLVRVYTPAWLEASPSGAEHGAVLRALAPIVDSPTAAAAKKPTAAALRAASAALAGQRRSDEPWPGFRSTAGQAALSAARVAIKPASLAAAWSVASASWAAAEAVVDRDKQAPVGVLHASAVDLVERMLAVEA